MPQEVRPQDEYYEQFVVASDLAPLWPEGSLALGKVILRQLYLSRGLRLQTLIHCAAITGDWDEGEDYRLEAERLYGVLREVYYTGSPYTDDPTEEFFVDVRGWLDGLARDQIADRLAWPRRSGDDNLDDEDTIDDEPEAASEDAAAASEGEGPDLTVEEPDSEDKSDAASPEKTEEPTSSDVVKEKPGAPSLSNPAYALSRSSRKDIASLAHRQFEKSNPKQDEKGSQGRQEGQEERKYDGKGKGIARDA